MSGHHGDDLDDDYVPDELVASSAEEDGAASDNVEGLLSAPESEQEDVRGKEVSAKRKRREREKERQAKVASVFFFFLLAITKLSRVYSSQKRKLDDVEPCLAAAQPPQEFSEYLSIMQARVFPAKSKLELLDESIPGESGVRCPYPPDLD